VRARKSKAFLKASADKSLHNHVGTRVMPHEKGGLVRTTRDFGQRKVYGAVRVSLAMIRLSKAETKTEKEKAGKWLFAWVSFGGLRRSKADRHLAPGMYAPASLS
jgi:hypothetical protein